MIASISESKTLTKYKSCKYKNVNLMVKNVVQIKSGITISVGVSVKIKKYICARNIKFAILVLVLVKMVNIKAALLVIQ